MESDPREMRKGEDWGGAGRATLLCMKIFRALGSRIHIVGGIQIFIALIRIFRRFIQL